MYMNGQLGHWMSNLPADVQTRRPVDDDMNVDIAIIGGGMTGLWAAYFAKTLEPSLSVAVFEAERLGFGASGRNGGWASALVPGNRAKFSKATGQGLDGSRALQREFLNAVDELLGFLQEESIDADQHKGGTLSAAHTPAGLKRLLAKRQTDLHYGFEENEVMVLDPDEFRSRIGIAGVKGGLFYKDVARLNPAKMVQGLAKSVERKGVQIFEASRVDSAERSILSVNGHRVIAARTFICTEGYSAPFLGPRRLIPINSSMIVTRPLPESAWDRMGWAGNECLNDSAHTFIYAQRTADNRIAIGGRGAPYRFASGTGGQGATASSTVRQLQSKLEAFFPAVQFDVDHAWSGVLGVSRDWNGSVDWDPVTGMGHSGGYAGHGVTSAFVGGRTLAELALEKKSSRTSLPWVGYTAPKWEPEPLRWVGVHSMYRLFGLADKWEEHRGSTATSMLAKFGSRLAGLHE